MSSRAATRRGGTEAIRVAFAGRADAIACVHSALADGISRLELREEYADLVMHIAAARYRQVASIIPPSALPQDSERHALSG